MVGVGCAESGKESIFGKARDSWDSDEINNTSNGKKVQVIKYSVYLTKVQTILEKLPCLAGSSLFDNHENTRQFACLLSFQENLSLAPFPVVWLFIYFSNTPPLALPLS